MSRPNVWLSVDFDYFVPEDDAWDFGHMETKLGIELVWTARLAQHQVRGVDLRKEMSLRKARPTPGAFWKTLQAMGYSFDRTKRIVVADSHRWAYFVFDERGSSPETTRLVHFDAHHDLFYSIYGLEVAIEDEDPGCDNWQIMTLFKQRGLKSLVIYPAWKGLREWASSQAQFDLIRRVGRREDISGIVTDCVTPVVWPDPRVAEAAGDVECVFICRSGAWVPPWHDRAFRRFCFEIGRICGKSVETPYREEEDIDPLDVRKMNHQAVKEASTLERALLGLIGPGAQ